MPLFEKKLIDTNLIMSILESYYEHIAPKSGLTKNYFIYIRANI
jgi:dUTPase